MSVAIEGKKSRLVAADNLLQFIECAIHMFLRPHVGETFLPHQRFGHTVYLCEGPIRNSIKHFCVSIRNLVLFDRVHSIVVLTNTQTRFVIELPSDFCRTVFYALPSHAHRSDLEIAATCAKLLGDTLRYMHRHLVPKGFSSFELLVVVKRNSIPGTETATPTGFSILPSAELVGPGWVRSPLKSTVLNETVLLSVYTDEQINR